MAFVASEGQVRQLAAQVREATTSSIGITSDYSTTYAEIWKRHSSVRTVTSFLARNIASLGLHAFRRVSDIDRERLTDHPLPVLLNRPNAYTTRFRMFSSLVHDLGIFDDAYWVKVKTANGISLMRLAPQNVTVHGDSMLVPDAYEVRGAKGKRVYPRDQVIHFRGYSPDSLTGSSPIESLRQVLAEEFEASRMREQTLRNGARTSGYLTRPVGAPEWSPAARDRFRNGWQAQYTRNGAGAGGTPILEDGMTFVNASMTPQQLQYIEVRKLTREEVASAYFIPPPMVGLMDGATFSNITEQHKMLYQDTLGPWLSMIVEELQLQLLPDLPDTQNVYLEFNLAEKLRGSFEEQAAAASTATGGPWMTRNEQRSRFNLGALPGGDELITPLNVVAGGQASPRDSGSQNIASAPRSARKAEPTRYKATDAVSDEFTDEARDLLEKFFTRQEKAVLSALGAKSPKWWDEERWNTELSGDLFNIAIAASKEIGQAQARALGFNGSDYDVDATRAFLEKASASRARMINATTLKEVETTLASDDPDVSHTFEVARSARTGTAATAFTGAIASFAIGESAAQVAGDVAQKIWVVGSRNPRPEHAAMDGETTPVREAFSNGAQWPGDWVLGADGVVNCQCSVDILIP